MNFFKENLGFFLPTAPPTAPPTATPAVTRAKQLSLAILSDLDIILQEENTKKKICSTNNLICSSN